jgi:hypothetical protein
VVARRFKVYAVIFQTGGLLLCYSQLSTVPFTIPSGETFYALDRWRDICFALSRSVSR